MKNKKFHLSTKEKTKYNDRCVRIWKRLHYALSHEKWKNIDYHLPDVKWMLNIFDSYIPELKEVDELVNQLEFSVDGFHISTWKEDTYMQQRNILHLLVKLMNILSKYRES